MRTLMLSWEDVAVVLVGLVVIALLLVVPAMIALRDVRDGRPDPGLSAEEKDGGGGRARR